MTLLKSLLNRLSFGFCLPGLPLELWGESYFSKLLKQIGKVIKIDIDSEDVSKGRFARVCFEVDTSKPLKMEIKYKRGNNIKSALIDYEKITGICYCCGLQDHKFEKSLLFPKSFSIKTGKRSVDRASSKDLPSENKQTNSMANENWVEIKPKHRQGPNMENPFKEYQKNLM